MVKLSYEPNEVSTITALTDICMPKRNLHAYLVHSIYVFFLKYLALPFEDSVQIDFVEEESE